MLLLLERLQTKGNALKNDPSQLNPRTKLSLVPTTVLIRMNTVHVLDTLSNKQGICLDITNVLALGVADTNLAGLTSSNTSAEALAITSFR